MPKESAGQKKTIERVMHEYKHGELKSGNGKKVSSRKQAVAISLKEAGASKYESKAQNKHNLEHTKRNERKANGSKKTAK
jgi:hypothetical protein